MIRVTHALPFALALVLATPHLAHAQKSRDDDYDSYAHLRVTSWGPEAGPPGTEVTIRGSGFTRATRIYLGDRQMRPLSQSATELVFRIPRQFNDGRITLRKPGRPYFEVGEFVAEVPPEIRRISPTSGVAGTRVIIRGRGFADTDTVVLGDRELPIIKRRDKRIMVEIPAGLSVSGPIWVVRASGARARSPEDFRVLSYAPRIARVDPSTGSPGDTVRLYGDYFTDQDQVLYSDVPAAVVGRGAGWVDVSVPANADSSSYFIINGPGGTSRSPIRFGLKLLPHISRLSTYSVAPGATIEVYGQYFNRSTRVEIAGRRARILRVQPDQITVVIPRGIRGGTLYVLHGDHRIPAPKDLVVGFQPQVDEWGPSEGPPGTLVTVRGSNLRDVEVLYRDRPVVIEASPRGELRFRVPDTAQSGRITLRSPYGELTLRKRFNVTPWARVTDVAPLAGAVGTTITIRGQDLHTISAYYIGDTLLQWVTRGRAMVVVRVPDGARTGLLSWDNYGVRRDRGQRFEVWQRQAPVLRSVTRRAKWNEELVLRGLEFHPDMRVSFGTQELPLRAVDDDGRKAWVIIPEGLRGRDFVYITSGPHRVRSPYQIQIVPDRRKRVERSGESASRSRQGR